ncbi:MULTISPECIES: hypothetical protein [Mesorhizobium]|uniref:Uncharacterized protein n=1 Tax=Mesorhizobium delmotii TaxID=1631247 RepID=A0A2P9AAW8_9HYPH|nr:MULTISPECIES: hypothetical protein [Mesorhizobium]RWE95147.1 MAG: hypothetical protein EOS43_25495 [Mesorhizobium sp.]SJM28256.1 hypothetical protein BQ8482_110186 [Mesorhizobium delmotii]
MIAGGRRINLIDYELCVLQALRERIRAKEIWVVGADRHRNPDDDLPKDFDRRRAEYYADLGLSMDARAFTAALKAEMEEELRSLDAALPGCRSVRILWRGKKFEKDSKPFYVQTDFLWSIPFRAKPETAAPPARCQF